MYTICCPSRLVLIAHISFRYLDATQSGRFSCMGEEGGARQLVGWVRAPPVSLRRPTAVLACQQVSIWLCENLGIQSAELGAPQQPSGPGWPATWSSYFPALRLVSRAGAGGGQGAIFLSRCVRTTRMYHHDDDGISQRCGSARVGRAPSGTDRAAGGCPPAHNRGRPSRRVVDTSTRPLILASAQVDSVPHVLSHMAEIRGAVDGDGHGDGMQNGAPKSPFCVRGDGGLPDRFLQPMGSLLTEYSSRTKFRAVFVHLMGWRCWAYHGSR